VDTIARFLAMSARDTRDLLTVVGGRVQMELRGLSCVQLSMMAPPRKGIAVTRSFGKAVTAWPEMREACAWYASAAYAVDIAFRQARQVMVEDMRYGIDVDAARCDIRRHQDLHGCGAEGLQRALPLALRLVAVQGLGVIPASVMKAQASLAMFFCRVKTTAWPIPGVRRSASKAAFLSAASTNMTDCSIRSTVVEGGAISTDVGSRTRHNQPASASRRRLLYARISSDGNAGADQSALHHARLGC
jgi:hypothetical protein